MKLLKLILSLIQMIISIILFFLGKNFSDNLYRFFTKIAQSGGGSSGLSSLQGVYTNVLLIIFGLYFIIGLVFFIDTLKTMNKEDWSVLRNKKFWWVIIIGLILMVLYIILN